MIKPAVMFAGCVRNEGQGKYCNESYGWASGNIAALPTEKFTASNFVICQPVSVLRKQVCMKVVLCVSVTATRHFKGLCLFHI